MKKLPETLRFLAKTPEGQVITKQIAEAGRERADTSWRVADMRIATFRVLLEYSRLYREDGRMSLVSKGAWEELREGQKRATESGCRTSWKVELIILMYFAGMLSAQQCQRQREKSTKPLTGLRLFPNTTLHQYIPVKKKDKKNKDEQPRWTEPILAASGRLSRPVPSFSRSVQNPYLDTPALPPLRQLNRSRSRSVRTLRNAIPSYLLLHAISSSNVTRYTQSPTP